MASPPILDFERLTAVIAGEEPAGTSVPFAIREKLEAARKEVNPDDFDRDDPARPEQAVYADWPAIERLASSTLTDKSKDLLVAARLTEALTKLHGFAGLRDGLRLMRMLVADAWDRLHPSIEDGDLEVRGSAFNWLDDPDRGSRFPNAVRFAPLFALEGRSLGWMDWRLAQDGRGTISREELDRIIQGASHEVCQQAFENVDESLQELNSLTQALDAKMGPLAPAMTMLRPAIQDCHTLIKQILQKKAPAGVAASEEGSPEPGTAGQGSSRASSREEAYRQMIGAAETLRQLEPHSPVPYLIFRAVELGALPFPQLMQKLIRDMNVLGELNRELGINQEQPA